MTTNPEFPFADIVLDVRGTARLVTVRRRLVSLERGGGCGDKRVYPLDYSDPRHPLFCRIMAHGKEGAR